MFSASTTRGEREAHGASQSTVRADDALPPREAVAARERRGQSSHGDGAYDVQANVENEQNERVREVTDSPSMKNALTAMMVPLRKKMTCS